MRHTTEVMMVSQQDLYRYIRAISNHLALDIEDRDNSGSFTIPLGDQPDMLVELQGEEILIRCCLGIEWPGEDSSALAALEANLLGRHTFGGVLGISESKEFVIWFRIGNQVTEGEFIDLIEKSAAASKLWQQALQELCVSRGTD